MVVSELEVLEVVVSLELGAARARVARRVRVVAGSGVEVPELLSLSGSGRALAVTFCLGRVLAAGFAFGLALALAVLCFARAFAFGATSAGALPSELSVSCSDPHPVGGGIGLLALFREGGIEA